MDQLEKCIYEAIAVLPHHHEEENEEELGASTREVIYYVNEKYKENINENCIKEIVKKSTLFSSSQNFDYLSFTKPIYFKYRSLSNESFFIDILINQRLFAAKLHELNDPNEGMYYCDLLKYTEETKSAIRKEENSLRICSLSKTLHNILLWSHYADGHKGIAIGLELKPIYTAFPLKYNSTNLSVERYCKGITAMKNLKNKHKDWKYEREVRVFTKRRKFVDIKIKIIVLGMKMNKEEKKTLKKLITNIDKDIIVVDNFKGNFSLPNWVY